MPKNERTKMKSKMTMMMFLSKTKFGDEEEEGEDPFAKSISNDDLDILECHKKMEIYLFH